MQQHFTLTILFILITFSLPLDLSGQGEFALNLQYNQQFDELRKEGLRNGWGLSMDFLSGHFENPSSPVRIQLGGRFDASFTGNEPTGLVNSGLFGNEYDVEVNNSNLGGYGMIRLSLQPTDRLQVYADGLLGVRWFQSMEATQTGQQVEQIPMYETRFLRSNLSPSWGSSAGVLFFVSNTVALNLCATYLQGTRASFVDLESIETLPSNTYNFTVREARPRQLMVQLGINMLMAGTESDQLASGK